MNRPPQSSILLMAFLIGMLSSPSLAAQSKKIWDFPTPAPILASPTLSPDGTIYIGSYDRKIYALSPGGDVLWATNLPPPVSIYHGVYTGVYGTPAVGADGTIYVPSENGKLLALNPADGAVKWTYTNLVEGMYSSPAIGPDGTVYVGSYDSNLYALNPNGTRKWFSRFDSTIFASPAVGLDGTIYCGADDGKLYALNPLNGNRQWTFDTGSFAITASPAIGADGTLYLGVGSMHNPKFYSISSAGATNWVFTTGNRIRSSAALGPDGTVYFGCDDGKLYALDPNGTEKWAFPAGEPIGSSPAIAADGTIYFGSDDGNLFAVDSEGNELWRFETDDYVFTSPAIGSDGTIYIASADGNLYVLRGCSPPAVSEWPMFRQNLARAGRAMPVVTNRPPVLDTISDRIVTAEESLTFTSSAGDPDSDQQLTFRLGLGAPVGASIDSATGLFEWTPSDAEAGVYLITVVVTDDGLPPLSDAGCFSVTVEPAGTPANQPPELEPVADQAVHPGALLTVALSATDPDVPANTLTYSLSDAPDGASVDAATGIFTWTPEGSQAGTTNLITATVTDDGVPPLSDATSFTVTVIPLVIRSVASNANEIGITWSTIPGARYRIQYKASLSDAEWIDLPDEVVALEDVAATTQTTGASLRFYRILFVQEE